MYTGVQIRPQQLQIANPASRVIFFVDPFQWMGTPAELCRYATSPLLDSETSQRKPYRASGRIHRNEQNGGSKVQRTYVQSRVKSSGTAVKTHQKCHFPKSHHFGSSTALAIRIADIKVLS
jgi:hypothetical protein